MSDDEDDQPPSKDEREVFVEKFRSYFQQRSPFTKLNLSDLYTRMKKIEALNTFRAYGSVSNIDENKESELTYDILTDVYNVHRCFVFGNYHFKDYDVQLLRKSDYLRNI